MPYLTKEMERKNEKVVKQAMNNFVIFLFGVNYTYTILTSRFVYSNDCMTHLVCTLYQILLSHDIQIHDLICLHACFN